MSDRSRVGLFGRLLTILGIVWILLPLLAAITGLRLLLGFVDLPILVGIVLLFVGRAMVRRSRRKSIEPIAGSEQAERGEQAPPQDISVRTPPQPKPVTPRAREIQTAPEPEAKAMAEALENMEEEIAEAVQQAGSPKTSAEMVAEARERFGRRP